MIESICDQKITNISKKLKKNILKKFFIVNVQGDQPFVEPKVIEKMINIFYQSQGKNKVITPIYKLKKDAIFNPNIVKLILNHKNQVIYFSRLPIPYIRGYENEKW